MPAEVYEFFIVVTSIFPDRKISRPRLAIFALQLAQLVQTKIWL
jgi:hypothetical protein